MNCRTWVDPQKFSKKTRKPTPRARVATGGIDLPTAKPHLLRHCKEGTKAYQKYEAQLDRAVRCGGQLTVDLRAGNDGQDYDGSVVVEVQCENCGETIHPQIYLDTEIAIGLLTLWVQSLCDECGRAKGHSVGCETGNAAAERYQNRQ